VKRERITFVPGNEGRGRRIGNHDEDFDCQHDANVGRQVVAEHRQQVGQDERLRGRSLLDDLCQGRGVDRNGDREERQRSQNCDEPGDEKAWADRLSPGNG
jgi:hypothetical protein